jgi:phage baseplate assembly protein W
MAKAMRLPTVEFPADWNRYGVSAGPKRNRAMFRAIEPHLVIAFHDDLKYSKGTRHMVGLCGTKVPALIFTTQDSEEEIRRRTRMLLRRMKARV